MKDRVHLYHALDQLRLPDKDGKQPVFSFEFIAKGGERAGQKLFASKAVINHFSADKAKKKLEAAKEPKPQAVSKRQSYDRWAAGVIAIRIIESPDFETGTIVSPVKKFITRINGLKTFI